LYYKYAAGGGGEKIAGRFGETGPMITYDGILLCDKPYGLTSHKVIEKLRMIIGQKKIGHTGTLDPRATGLLIICLGRATKISQFLSVSDKSYEAEIRLGIRSETYDSEGVDDDTESGPVPDLTVNQVEDILKEFKGKIIQKVPLFSSVKMNGRRLHRLARKGKKIEPPEREIEIKNIELTELDLPYVRIKVSCSKGTYIRTLANDIGERIGCGAYLSGLRRIRAGLYSIDHACTMNEIKYYRQAGILKRYIIPIEKVLPFPSIMVDENFSPNIINGQAPHKKDVVNISSDFDVNDYVSLCDHKGVIRAIGTAETGSSELDIEENKHEFFKYVRVLN
jgi:tRNA pseudouridine55 synthase